MIARIHGPGRRIALVLAVCGALTTVSPAATAASHPEPDPGTRTDVILQTDELRIYRIRRSDGRRALVLTNLDEGGRRMGGEGPPPAPRDLAPDRRSAISGTRAETEDPAPEERGATPGTAPTVQVIVRRDDGSRHAVEAGDVEMDPRGDGTTIIINIDATPASPPAASPPVLVAPVVAIPGIGGIRGPIRYPEHHHFLGYGHDISSPGYFGGLGLNAGNGFGLSNARPCGRGFDCMFGPGRDHP